MLEAPKVTVWPTIFAWSYVKSRQLSPKLTAVDLKQHNLILLRLALTASTFIGAENCPFESTIFWWAAFYWVQMGDLYFTPHSMKANTRKRTGFHHDLLTFIKGISMPDSMQNWKQHNSWHGNNLFHLFSLHLLPSEGLVALSYSDKNRLLSKSAPN